MGKFFFFLFPFNDSFSLFPEMKRSFISHQIRSIVPLRLEEIFMNHKSVCLPL